MWKWGGILFLTGAAFALSAAPYQNRSGTRHAFYDDLRHEVDNHEAEIRMFQERLNTQEVIVDALRQQVRDANDENRELVKGSTILLEDNVLHLGTSVKGITDDLRKLQAHGNDTAKVLNQHKKKMEEIEKKMDKLRETLQLVLDALQVSGKEKVYEVVSGDTLEKIARKHETKIKKIKELNQLTSDRIYVGQKLKIP